MNRQERRRIEKQQKIRNAKDLISQEMKQQILKEVDAHRVEALMSCFVLALHEKYGFEKERCLRALQRIDSYMEPYVNSLESVEELRDRVENDVGIRIQC